MISVVVPCFNGGKRLVENLQELQVMLRESRLQNELIVVDDASTDDSVAQLAEFRVIRKEKNTGFGDTVDKGIRAAKGEIVFVLNATDILPETASYFKKMLAPFKDEKVFSVAARKREEKDHGCGEIYFEKGFFLHRRADKVGKFSAWADGGAQALRREYYLKIGGFDPLYKFYWEDVDLGYRAWKAGDEVYFELGAVLIHKKTEGPIAKYYSPRERRVINLRNQFIFTWKNSDFKYLMLYFLWEAYHATVALKNLDGDFFRAYWQAVFAWPEIFVARWRQKKVTRRSDDQVLHVFQ